MKDSKERQFIALHDLRGAMVTANATVTTGTPTSLLAGDADYFLDPVEMTLANDSTVAVSVALLSDGTTVRTIVVPVGDTVQLTFGAPLKQENKGTPWLVDMGDITGTTVSVGALFRKNQTNS